MYQCCAIVVLGRILFCPIRHTSTLLSCRGSSGSGKVFLVSCVGILVWHALHAVWDYPWAILMGVLPTVHACMPECMRCGISPGLSRYLDGAVTHGACILMVFFREALGLARFLVSCVGHVLVLESFWV